MSTLAVTGIAVVLGASALCPISDQARIAAAAESAAYASAQDTVKVVLAIRGMTCGSCATTARLVLQRIPGVVRAAVSYDSASAVVVYDRARTSPSEFIARLKDMTGYEATVVGDPPKRSGTSGDDDDPRNHA